MLTLREAPVAKTLFYTHPVCQEHEPGPQHPEQPRRLTAILEALEAPEFAVLNRREAPMTDILALKEVHHDKLVDVVIGNVPENGYAAIDGDTIMSPSIAA